MGDTLHMAIGVLGNAASLLLYAAPMLTFKRIIRNKSTEEFSCVPYIIALFNCFLYTWYGLPVVSHKWENFPLITINGLGILLELSFILIYFWFAEAKRKKMVSLLMVPVIMASCIMVLVSTFALHTHRQRKVFVGSIGLVAAAAMYGSPLVAVKRVIKTKSVEYMPFYLSFFSFLASSLWMTYGLVSRDIFLACPNLLGSPLGLFQIMLYCMYRKKGVTEEPIKVDLEKNGVELKPQLPAVINGTNGKI